MIKREALEIGEAHTRASRGRPVMSHNGLQVDAASIRETRLVDDVLLTIMKNHDIVIENPIIDRYRFPTESFEPSSASSILSEVAHLWKRRNEFDQFAGCFSDDESISLYRELLTFRALGPCRYALPLSTSDYMDLYLRERTWITAGNTKQMYSWPMSVFRMEVGNCPFEMEVWNGSPTALLSWRQYFFDRNAVRIQPESGDVVFDLGACQGDTALVFAATVGPTGRVFSFEPMPVLQAQLRSNIARNPHLAGRIELVEQAVSSVSGQSVRMADGGPGSRISPHGTIEAVTVSIDDFVDARGLQKVDFIKMDIEGAEQAAIRGAAHTISRFQPKLAIAAYHGSDALWEIPLLITEINPRYRLYLDHYTNHLEETIIYAIADPND
jgi:FkbM family methyltransferase